MIMDICAESYENRPAMQKESRLPFTQEEFYRAYYEPICELFLDKESGLSLHGTNAEIALTDSVFF